jgi:hypothetical protein
MATNPPTDRPAIVHVLKLSAAQRQLDAAIRMDLGGEDPLAVTTVAAAASRILKDLREDCGHDVLADHHFTSLVGTARALLRGEVAEADVRAFERQPGLWRVLQMLVTRLERIGPEKSLAEIRREIDVDATAVDAAAYWRTFNRVPNFLKHADHDAKAHIRESDVDPSRYLMAAIGTYLELGAGVTPEIRAWFAKAAVDQGTPVPEADALGRKIAEVLAPSPAEERGRVALEIINRLKEAPAGL